ncbi:transcription elongation factor A protein 3-like [Hyperolius riggenbachi]|uniref:transcription elongation factor A protein 3-like n=1 Tax=Hyperolius riggenbachi TaxID=752182 RepID=UPI0035A33678
MESEEELLKIGRRLEKRISEDSMDHIMDLLKELQRFPVTVPLLRSTRIGVTVNKLRKQKKTHPTVALAKVIIRDWKRILESSYKNNKASAVEVKLSPAKTEPISLRKEEKKLHTKRLHTSPHKKSHAEKRSSCSDALPSSPPPHAKEPISSMECPKSNSPSPSKPAAVKETKLKRSHSADVHSSHSKKPERRLSLNASLPSPTSSKSSTTTKEERRHSSSNPTAAVLNEPSKTSTNKEERASSVLASSPTCSSPPSSVFLPNCYETGNSVRDKCVDMVTAALKTDGDFKDFGANCERLAWEIEDWIYKEMRVTDMKYRNRIRSRISNLKDPKNPSLRRNVLCGIVSTQSIATMTAEEMASDELKELRNTLTQEAIREHQMAKTGGTHTDLLQCDKCRKKNCTYNQVQTRSADEPMTTFVLCNECGHRWKFC